ncbi:MAG: hypothetical protein ACOVNU_09290 [Candidatus Kapaibacteriota bacterium]
MKPNKQKPILYKVGDKFKEEDDKREVPLFIISIQSITKNGDVGYDYIKTKYNQTLKFSKTKSAFENELKDYVPYVEAKKVNTLSKQKTTSPKTKFKTEQIPSKIVKSNTPALNLSCKEIKDAIKGLTLLVNLGDNTVKKELNELKQLLKTQNCK